jgi:hypothetical protein
MHCQQLEWLVLASLHGELAPAELEDLELHLARCEGCRRRHALEQAFEARLRQVPETPAPAELRHRVEAASGRRTPLAWLVPRRMARPAAWAAAGALAAAMVLLLGRGHERAVPAAAGELLGMLVCIGCELRPEAIPQHAQNRGLDHVNGLRDAQGRTWHFLDTPEQHAFVVSDELLHKQVRVRGDFDAASRTIVLRSVEELARTGWMHRGAGRPELTAAHSSSRRDLRFRRT